MRGKKHKLHVQFEQGGGKRERASVKQTASERRRESKGTRECHRVVGMDGGG